TALLGCAALTQQGRGPARVHWIARDRGGAPPFLDHADDPLPARADLVRRANAVAAAAPWLTTHAGGTILGYERGRDGALRVHRRGPGGTSSEIVADHVLALVGYRPDTDLFRELRVHLCYGSEGPMGLAAALASSG